MRLPPLIYKSLGKSLLFIALFGVGITFVLRNDIVQRYRFFRTTQEIGSFFYKKNMNIKHYFQLNRENRSLIQENALLLKQNILYRNHIEKTLAERDLEKLLAGEEDSTLLHFDFILAKVIKNSTATEHNYLILNKGKNDGITEDLGVITPTGVIGITRAVGPHYTYVLSFINDKQSVSAKIGKSDVFGSLQWNSTEPRTATLSGIPLSVEVRGGDTVSTSGYSSLFPPDIPIGTSISHKTTNGIYNEIKVGLLQNYSNLNYVIIVKPHNKEEVDSLSASIPTYSSR